MKGANVGFIFCVTVVITVARIDVVEFDETFGGGDDDVPDGEFFEEEIGIDELSFFTGFFQACFCGDAFVDIFKDCAFQVNGFFAAVED